MVKGPKPKGTKPKGTKDNSLREPFGRPQASEWQTVL